MSRWAVILAVGAIFLLAAGGVYYFVFRESRAEVSLEFVKPDGAVIGQPFTLGVSFSNYSERILEDVKLSLLLPDGVVFSGASREQRVSEQVVGDLGPGSLNQQSFELIILEGAQSLKRLEARLSYKLGGSATVFQASSKTDVVVGRPAVDLSFRVPEKVFSGEDFEISLEYQNTTDREIKDLSLKLDYPPVFQFKNSNELPTSGKNVWEIGTLPRGEKGILVISGSAVGPANSLFAFQAAAETRIQGQRYPLNSQSANLSIASSPLSLDITVNNDPNYLARVGDTLTYALHYRNNSNVAMANVTIRATLTGELYDFASVRSDGAFNSLTNTFTWNAGNAPALANLPPSSEGKVEIYVQLQDSFPIRRLSDKNFALKVQAQIESPTVPPGTVADKTISVAKLETRTLGRLEVDARGYFRDAAAGILNSGSYPPQANRATQYTIHWLVKNYATDVTGAKVSAFLQSNTRFTGVVKSNTASVPVYNPSSGEVSWDIGNIPATKGLLSEPLTAIFQIENTPAINEVGRAVVLLGETKIEAQDTFAGVALSNTDSPIATDLPDDGTITQSDRTVRP